MRGAIGGGGTVLDAVRIDDLGIRFRLELDALAASLVVFTTGLAAIVLALQAPRSPISPLR